MVFVCFCVFLKTLGDIFSNQTTLGAIFDRMFRNVAQIFNKSKLLGVGLHPRLLHHCAELIYFACSDHANKEEFSVQNINFYKHQTNPFSFYFTALLAGLISFSIFFGIITARLGKEADIVTRFVAVLNKIFLKMIGVVIW